MNTCRFRHHLVHTYLHKLKAVDASTAHFAVNAPRSTLLFLPTFSSFGPH